MHTSSLLDLTLLHIPLARVVPPTLLISSLPRTHHTKSQSPQWRTDLSSDHDPLLINVRALSDSPRFSDRPVKRVGWRSYREINSLNSLIHHQQSIRHLATYLQDLVQSVLHRHIYQVPVSN